MTPLKVDDLVQAKWVVGTANSGGSGWTDPRAMVAAGADDKLDLYRVVQLYADAFVVEHVSGGPRIVVSDDRKVIPVSVLILDGKRYEGTASYRSSDGLLDVALAQCGHCGFVWNDKLSTQWTPPPSGRCPNEYNHIYAEPEVAVPHDLDSWVDDEEDSGWFAMVAVGRRDEPPVTYLTPAQAREYAGRLRANAAYAETLKAPKDGS